MFNRFRNTVGVPALDFSDQSIEETGFLLMDTELTGLNPKKDSIVSIGAIRMAGRRILLGETFYRIVKPRTTLTSESVVVHGITHSEVRGLPLIAEAISEFIEFGRGCVLVGHFISLDLAFLNRELKCLNNQTIDNPVIDTMRLYGWIRKHSGDFSSDYGEDKKSDLFSLARKYGIQVTEAHHALADAFLTAQLFQRFLVAMPDLGITTLKDLLKIGKL